MQARPPASYLVVEAIQNGEVESFYHNLTADTMPWDMALRQIAKLQDVPVEFQKAFQSAWIATKCIPLKTRNHSILCAALRTMFPLYTGPAVRLFRGAGFNEFRRRQYSLSWTDDRATAERFARDYSGLLHGSVVLETVAPAAAIIAKIEYPEPWTNSEREEILREHPNTRFDEYHDEDGDSVRIHNQSIRLVGFNAPETRNASCPAEAELGARATRRLRELVRAGGLDFEYVRCSYPEGTQGTSAYNWKRDCGMLRSNGKDVGSILIAEGLAVPFVCGATHCPATPRPWCHQ